MPHKEPIAALCDEVVGIARLVGTVNAIRREPDGRLVGANTDGSGFRAGLEQAGYSPTGKRVLLIGVGGAGTAIAFSLAQAGAREIALANRTAAKAETVAAKVAEAFPGTKTGAGAADPTGFDIVINATPLGMGATDALPLDVSKLAAETVVAEIVMRPERTRLVEEAERRGCRVHLGLPMLTCQIEEVITFLGLDRPPAEAA
jgi:shikimate dehydrogenase